MLSAKSLFLNKKDFISFLTIFYLSELIALAFGFKSREIGLNYHRVRPKTLLERTNFAG